MPSLDTYSYKQSIIYVVLFFTGFLFQHNNNFTFSTLEVLLNDKGEGGASGISQTVMTSHTSADVFHIHLKGYSRAFHRKQWIHRLGSKKGALF
jgi:hypothetical protein